MNREPADGDLLGKELADAVASVLAQSGPRGMPALRVADMAVALLQAGGESVCFVVVRGVQMRRR